LGQQRQNPGTVGNSGGPDSLFNRKEKREGGGVGAVFTLWESGGGKRLRKGKRGMNSVRLGIGGTQEMDGLG